MSIFCLLLIVEPLLAMTVIAVLGSAYLFIYSVVRKKLLSAGKLSSAVNTIRYQLLLEVMGSIKELKILGREQKFLDSYSESTSKYIGAETISQLSPIFTRYMIEAIAFGGMVLIALYLIATKEDVSKFMPLLGLYALAGYRLMPAMQQIFTSLSSLKYHVSSLDILYEQMQLPDLNFPKSSHKLGLENHLQLTDVSYSYPFSEKFALKNINLKIKKHAMIGLVGSSGAGKTTLVDILLGLLSSTSGKLEVDKVDVNQSNVASWQKNIGYVPQNIFLLDDTFIGNIALGVSQDEINFKAVEKAARLANLHDFICEEFPQGYNTVIGEAGIRLSGGQRQRIGIARALYHEPELLIFDEATSALDGVTEKVIMEAIKSFAHKRTIILIAHRLNTVKECDVIYVLNKGEIVGQGSYQELYQSNEAFQSLANESISA